MHEDDLEVLKRALIVADLDLGVAAAQRLVDNDADPRWILEDGMAVAMFDLGRDVEARRGVPARGRCERRGVQACNAIVEPALLANKDSNAPANALVLLATVKGDLHDLGKNMVGAMLRTSGFDVHDLGKDVGADAIIEAINELQPAIVGLSALLTTTVPYQETVIKKLEAAGLRDRVIVMVGGAPVTPEWAEKIGADGYANNAPEAVEIAKKLVGASV